VALAGPHPQPQQRARDQNVSAYAIDDGERLLLCDPLSVPPEIEQLVVDRETAIVLTAPSHERAAQSLVEHLGVPAYTPLPDNGRRGVGAGNSALALSSEPGPPMLLG
jgi:hypothetical protein